MADNNVKEEIEVSPSSIEDIDYALRNWVDEQELFCTTNKGWRKAPVKWVIGERSFQTKEDSQMRDATGALILPMITVERTGMVKDLARKGTVYGNVPPALASSKLGDTITIARQVNQKKTANFANAHTKRKRGQLNLKTSNKNEKIVYQTVTVPLPVYVEVSYTVTLRTEYQQQMNELLQPFITRPRGATVVKIKHNEHEYEAFIQSDFSQDNTTSALDKNERNFKTTVEIKVLGMLLGDGPNDEKPKIVKRENAVEVKFPRERVMLGDEPWHSDDSDYRE